ncbi:DUF898 domain-containing protein [Allosphingosinicella flava]|uniref:DUF898 domain-containing protein n=1 Tax=Allosphingosinicella flava TaxID=2771430 RepID=A0A7T2GJ27_9SPHN|nr:YjgN family protein [Sphingosinicella flava]QPQ54662.1 DUF898 domain-containing protein [Sphingosinicella flava]
MNSAEGQIDAASDRPVSSFAFTGTWREFLPIALTNLALTIVTLGIYRFWAKARERRYLWSRTRFIDDTFEWTGTGKEMFVGFLIVMAAFLPGILVLNVFVEAMVLRGEWLLGGAITAFIYIGLLYLFNVARFRALRYQLSRTYWHGIRGGSADPGWRYGLSAMWRYGVGIAAMGLLLPWSMASLWNARWNRMSFGSHPFTADALFEPLMKRWMLVYFLPLGVFLVLTIAGGLVAGTAALEGSPESAVLGLLMLMIPAFVLTYVLFLILGLAYYALLYRICAGATSVAGIDFHFNARTWDWVKLILGNIGLVIVTLGVGIMFLSYRNYSFLVRHMEAYGLIDLDLLSQSAMQAPGDAEGLADAFDFGSF